MLFITIIYILMLLLLKIHMNKQSAKRRLDSKTQEAFQKCSSLARQGDSVGEFLTALLIILMVKAFKNLQVKEMQMLLDS